VYVELNQKLGATQYVEPVMSCVLHRSADNEGFAARNRLYAILPCMQIVAHESFARAVYQLPQRSVVPTATTAFSGGGIVSSE
jgi:hypothetical protein